MQLSENVRAIITLMRLPYILMLDFLCVLFIVTFQKGFQQPELVGLAVITVVLVTAGGAAINDYCDVILTSSRIQKGLSLRIRSLLLTPHSFLL
jgi:4-hydroxybenzoate polyprenyltransferase